MGTRSRALRRAAVVLCVGALIAAAPPALAGTGPDDRKTTAATEAGAIWAVQEKLDAVVKDIRAAASKDTTVGISGVVVDLEGKKLDLYWKGDLPAAVTARIGAARADGLGVVVRQAPYTEAELLAEADRISRKPLRATGSTGRRMMRVSPKPDGTGLDVGLDGLPSDVAPRDARKVVPALDSAVPLSVTATDPVSFTTRYFDSAAYWGGSFLLRRSGNNACTSAFGVTGLNGAATYLLTAAHCGEGTWGGGLYDDGTGNAAQNVYGSTIPAGRSTQMDVELILTPSGSAGYVYWGTSINPPLGDPGSPNGVPVRGSIANSTGNAFCLSGSYSGSVCDGSNVRITGTGVTLVYDPPYNGVSRVTNLLQGSDVTGSRATGIVGQGDSGGPVASPTNDGGLLARGVISGMATGGETRPCAGYVPAGRVCSRVVYFADLQASMATIGVRLNTA